MIDNLTAPTAFYHARNETKSARRFGRKFMNDWSFDLASMLAYHLMVALVPIAIVVFGIIGLVLNDRPQARQDLKDKIIHLFPDDNATQIGIKQVVDLAFNQLSKDAGLILALGIIFAIIGASRLFVAIDRCMTIIYRLPERSFLRQNVMSIALLLFFPIIITLMFIASSVPSALMNMIPGGGGRFGVFIAGILVSLAIAFVFFEIIYLVTPNKKMTFKKTWCGALVASITLEVFIILFPLYVRNFLGNYAGQIGLAIILILFLYFFSIILIFGAQINAYFYEYFAPLPNKLGTYLSRKYHEDMRNNPEDFSDDRENGNRHSTNNDKSQQHGSQSMIRWLASKKRPSVEPLTERNNMF